MKKEFTDFEGNVLRIGDDVFIVDIARYCNGLRRGYITGFGKAMIRVQIQRVSGNAGQYVTDAVVNVYPSGCALIAHNPAREEELTNGNKPVTI